MASFEVLDASRVVLRDSYRKEEVELGIVSRSERRLFFAVHKGKKYVGIAPEETPSLEDEHGVEQSPNVPGTALMDALVLVLDGNGLQPAAAAVHVVACEGNMLRVRVAIRNPFFQMPAPLKTASLVQTLCLYALP